MDNFTCMNSHMVPEVKTEPDAADYKIETLPHYDMATKCPNTLKEEKLALQDLLVISDGQNVSNISFGVASSLFYNERDIGSSEIVTRHKEPFSNQGIPVKIETSEEINIFKKIDEATFEDWKAKNEEAEIKEENLENNECTFACDEKHKGKLNLSNVLQYDTCDFQIKKDKPKTNLLRHKSSKKVKTFNCYQCDFQTIWKEALKTHLLRHMNPGEVNMFKCDQCEFKTIRKGVLKRHVLRHINPEEVNMFKCNQCKYQTIQKNNLTIHLLRHKNPEEIKMFKCDQCEYRTIQKSYLKKHLLRHKNPEELNMLKCNQCEFQTIHKSSLKRHTLWHKNPEELNMLKCDQCEFETIHKDNLRNHLLRHRSSEEVKRFSKEINRFKCDQCEFQSNRKHDLKRHFLRHMNSDEVKNAISVNSKPFIEVQETWSPAII